ncbi:precorrin-8X methylmutase [Deferribacterales bacterium RsTz2092]|nr:precorrin isomerase [Deferribacterales bacterium]
MKPHEIEIESFRLIDGLVDFVPFVEVGHYRCNELNVVKRMIHACGDIGIANSVRLSSNAYRVGIDALKAGAPVVCDVQMVVSGLSARVKADSDVYCFINEPEVVNEAKTMGETRARRALFYAAKRYPDAIYIIGNAPTALLALLELYRQDKISPALVIGIPVGFVMARESKDELVNTSLNYITCLGNRGGSPMSAAVLNALAIDAPLAN